MQTQITRSMSLVVTIWTLSLCLVASQAMGQAVRSSSRPSAAPKANVSAKTFKRPPMPAYIGVHQHAGRSLVATGNAFTSGAPLLWQDSARNSPSSGNWVITPLDDSLARIDWCLNDRFYGLQAMNINQPLRCFNGNNQLSQLWRLQRFPGYPSNFLLESLMYPGYCATFYQDGLYLMPIQFAASQQFWFDRPPTLVLPPVFRNSSQQYVPNPPLAPAKVQLVNRSQDKVIALLAELRNPTAAQEIEIPAGGSTVVELQRDAGATIYENYETTTLNGSWSQQQRTYQIPPMPLYDISIYEVFLQSIAIDRTGTSPNPIEDINYQPRSIGIFQVPAGDRLPESGSIDVMQTAERSRNPGGVRPLPSKIAPVTGRTGTNDPLKTILNEVQSRQKSF